MARGDHVEQSDSSDEALRWSVVRTADEVDVAIAGEMDLANAPGLARALSQIIAARPLTVTLDLADLSFLDSSGIRCLCNAAEEASAVGCRLVVRRPNSTVLRVLEITGVDKVLLDDAANRARNAPLTS